MRRFKHYSIPKWYKLVGFLKDTSLHTHEKHNLKKETNGKKKGRGTSLSF